MRSNASKVRRALRRMRMALKTPCINAIEMSRVATSEKDKSLHIFIFPTNLGLKWFLQHS